MPRIYVGTFNAYNNGSLKGAWLDLEDYDNKADFMGACEDLHIDESDPEIMFQAWEDIPDAFIGESHIDEEFWDYMNHPAEEAAKAAYMACFNDWSADGFDDRYRGEYRSWEDMAEELLAETGEINDIPERLRYYFDYEKYARDMRLGGDMCEDNLHFFWNN